MIASAVTHVDHIHDYAGLRDMQVAIENNRDTAPATATRRARFNDATAVEAM